MMIKWIKERFSPKAKNTQKNPFAMSEQQSDEVARGVVNLLKNDYGSQLKKIGAAKESAVGK